VGALNYEKFVCLNFKPNVTTRQTDRDTSTGDDLKNKSVRFARNENFMCLLFDGMNGE
jgi:hypothetical protein